MPLPNYWLSNIEKEYYIYLSAFKYTYYMKFEEFRNCMLSLDATSRMYNNTIIIERRMK